MPALFEPSGDPLAALSLVFQARRAQSPFRITISIVLAFCFGPIIGWRFTLAVLAFYLTLQALELYATDPSRPQPAANDIWHLRIGLALLATNSLIFGLPSIWLVLHLGPWGVACAAYLLTGAIINTVQLTLGCRTAFWASTAPFFLYGLLIPVDAKLVDPAIDSTILIGLAIGALLLAAGVSNHWLRWNATRAQEAAATRAQHAERDANERRLIKLARQDALTGLGNRDMLHAALTASLAANRPGALFIVDLDGFKDINDMLGHGTGDEVLREIAARIRAGGIRGGIRGGAGGPTSRGRSLNADFDTITRLGGDEFALVLPGLEEPDVAAEAAGLIARIGAPLKLRDDIVSIGASIGVALFPQHGADAGQLLANADLALYHAKENGRHRHSLYDAPLRDAAHEKLRLEGDLRRAVENGEFELFYQPQIRLADNALTGAEALLRWRHPLRGLLLPETFISPLEGGLLAQRLGQWILETACAQAAYWRENGLPELRIAVNLFAAQIRSADLPDRIAAACGKTGLPPTALELEITEKIILRQEDEIIAPLQALRDMGVGLAFDDYGTGYASLSLLKRYPVSKLKIDKFFIAGIADNADDAVIVFGLVNMARALGLKVVAEGVETTAQTALLIRSGCNEAQGFVFGEPVSAADFEQAWLPAPAPEPAKFLTGV